MGLMPSFGDVDSQHSYAVYLDGYDADRYEFMLRGAAGAQGTLRAAMFRVGVRK